LSLKHPGVSDAVLTNEIEARLPKPRRQTSAGKNKKDHALLKFRKQAKHTKNKGENMIQKKAKPARNRQNSAKIAPSRKDLLTTMKSAVKALLTIPMPPC